MINGAPDNDLLLLYSSLPTFLPHLHGLPLNLLKA